MKFSEAYRKLASSQKSSKGAPFYSLVVNRPLGRIFAAIAYPLGMTPNQVTVISALFTYSGIVLLAAAPPSVAVYFGVAACLVIGYALDSADGQVARLRGGGSLAGEWLDHVIDSGKIATLHLAALLMAYRTYDDAPKLWLLVPLGFSAVSVFHFFGMILTDLLMRTRNVKPAKPSSRNTLMSIAKLPTDYGILCLCFALVPWHLAFMVVYSGLALATAGYTFLVSIAWYRRISKLDAA